MKGQRSRASFCHAILTHSLAYRKKGIVIVLSKTIECSKIPIIIAVYDTSNMRTTIACVVCELCIRCSRCRHYIAPQLARAPIKRPSTSTSTSSSPDGPGTGHGLDWPARTDDLPAIKTKRRCEMFWWSQWLPESSVSWLPVEHSLSLLPTGYYLCMYVCMCMCASTTTTCTFTTKRFAAVQLLKLFQSFSLFVAHFATNLPREAL